MTRAPAPSPSDLRTGLIALAAALLLRGPALAQSLPPPSGGAPAAVQALIDYRIGPLDKLSVTVFQVKDLTVSKIEVDAGGQILLPLIGAVEAQGKTTAELSAEIAQRLAASYLQHPQVSVVVDEAVSQKVSVEGAVVESGVFELKGRTGLMEAVAMAKGAAKDADLHRVSIVRKVDGVNRAAIFDLTLIQSGKAKDPEIFGADVVVVGSSASKRLWRSLVEALPALIVFSYL